LGLGQVQFPDTLRQKAATTLGGGDYHLYPQMLADGQKCLSGLGEEGFGAATHKKGDF
jgi:hypothetical protein